MSSPPDIQILEQLRNDLTSAAFPLGLPSTIAAETTRRELLAQLDDYVLPRLRRIDAPLLTVLGGSTGAGKSTITNSLLGEEVSTPGVLRPTTRAPVLVCHPDDRDWFMSGGVLPELVRVTGAGRPNSAGLHVVTSEKLNAGLAILDSPDIDSVEIANHELAAQLLGAADLWLFVTTAARYADAVPWDYLARARERAIALAVVVNRIPAGAEQEITAHLAEMLDQNGLADTKIFAITEHGLTDGRLSREVDAVRDWLHSLSADAAERDAVIRTSLDGTIRSISARSERIADGIEVQASAAHALQLHARNRYEEALDRVDVGVGSGYLLRGEVLDQWRNIVGTGEFMDRMQRGVGRLRDRAKALLLGRKPPEDAVRGELEDNLELLAREAADRAALEVVEGWEGLPGGREALEQAPRGIDRASPEFGERLRETLGEWEAGVLAVVREMAEPKLATARALSFGINGVGVALMVAVFSSTGGITGGEAAVAGGTAAVSQAVLSAVFGEQAVRDLIAVVRDDLETRLAAIYSAELDRFGSLVDAIPGAELADDLRAIAGRAGGNEGL